MAQFWWAYLSPSHVQSFKKGPSPTCLASTLLNATSLDPCLCPLAILHQNLSPASSVCAGWYYLLPLFFVSFISYLISVAITWYFHWSHSHLLKNSITKKICMHIHKFDEKQWAPIWYCVNYRSVQVLTCSGYGVSGFGYGVRKPDPWVTHIKLYLPLILFWLFCI